MFRTLAIAALLSSGCSSKHDLTVHGGNLIELGGAPGEVTLVAVGHLQGVTPAPTLTMAVPSFPLQGRVVAAVPVLPVRSGDSWSLTYHPDGAPARSATLVPNPVSGVPGATALQFVDTVSTLDTTLTAPPASQAEKLAAYNSAVVDLKAVASYVKLALTQAQKGSTPVGGWKGVTVSLDASGLSLLDSAIVSAQEPVVTLARSSGDAPIEQEVSVGIGGMPASAFALAAGFAAIAVLPEATLFLAGYTLVTGLGALFVGDVIATQTTAVLTSADMSHDDTGTAIIDAMGYGGLRVQTLTAANVVQSNASGDIGYSGKLAGRSFFPPKCDPTKCANCLNCNVVWSGCFPAGDMCCGAGFWSIACHSGNDCKVCKSSWACVPSGGSCPDDGSTGTLGGIGLSDAGLGGGGTIGGGRDGGPPVGPPPDAGLPDGGGPIGGPGACGVVQVAGADAPEQHVVEMGASAGTFQFDWDTYSIPDEMVVTYQGATLFDTGCVGASGTQQIGFSGGSTQITVSVSPDCQPGTSGTGWQYTVGCPQ